MVFAIGKDILGLNATLAKVLLVQFIYLDEGFWKKNQLIKVIRIKSIDPW